MGAHKTASTSFQNICKNNQEVLIDQGLMFPQYSNWNQHSLAAWMSQKRDVKQLRLFLRTIFDETNAENCEITLISGEDFENFLVDTYLANEFEAIAKSEGYKDIEWIVIHRDPTDYLLSIYAEMSGYQMVLDLELMSNLILDCGYVSTGSSKYNYKFVFDIKKFSEFFRESVNQNLTVVPFEDFTFDFTGKVILNQYLDEKTLDILRIYAQNLGKKRVRAAPEKVEFRYVANFLGLKPDKIFHENNRKLVDSLIAYRINRNKTLHVDIESKFKEHFG